MSDSISHIAAFRATEDFAPESKIVVGENIWKPGVAGDRLYREVLASKPRTVGAVIEKAEALSAPFTAKATMGHLK
jgi:hypothetical protein